MYPKHFHSKFLITSSLLLIQFQHSFCKCPPPLPPMMPAASIAKQEQLYDHGKSVHDHAKSIYTNLKVLSDINEPFETKYQALLVMQVVDLLEVEAHVISNEQFLIIEWQEYIESTSRYIQSLHEDHDHVGQLVCTKSILLMIKHVNYEMSNGNQQVLSNVIKNRELIKQMEKLRIPLMSWVSAFSSDSIDNPQLPYEEKELMNKYNHALTFKWAMSWLNYANLN